MPKTATVTVRLAPGTDLKEGTVTVDIPGQVREITLRNNRVLVR